MAFRSSAAVLVFAVMAASIALEVSVVSAANHVVGGSTGWTIPSSSSFYSNWSATQTFAVGDTLEFDFTTGRHEVVHVPKSSYDACTTSNQIGSTLTTGPANFTLNASGNYYFICGFTGHCSQGQKLTVTVASTPSGSSPPPPTAGAPTTTAAPPRGSSTAPPPSTPTPGSGTTTAPPPSTPGSGGGSSAATSLPSGFRTAVGFSMGVALLSIASSLRF